MTSTAKLVSDSDLPLPINLDAERAILAAILLDNKALDPRILTPEDFFTPSDAATRSPNALLYAAMITMVEDGEPVDLVTLVDHLQAGGNLEKAGGAAYVSGLVDGV